MNKPGIRAATIGNATETHKVEVDITDVSLDLHLLRVEIQETPTMPPTRYAVISLQAPNEGNPTVLTKIFLGAVR